MKHQLMICIALGLIAATPSGVYEGRLRLSSSEAVLDEQRTFAFDIYRAKCFTTRGKEHIPTTCQTLIGVGYADKARVTVADGSVVRLDILELRQ